MESVGWVRLISGAQPTKIKRKEEKSTSQKRQQKQKEQKDRGCFVRLGVSKEREKSQRTHQKHPENRGEKGRKGAEACGLDLRAKCCWNWLKFQYVVRETEGYKLIGFVRRESPMNSSIAVRVSLLFFV